MLSPGDTVHHYRIVGPIGAGGMGEVFLAQDTVLDRKVALKFLRDLVAEDPNAAKRFLREAKAAAALDHPFICKIYETGEVGGHAYIAMEHVAGETLAARLARGPLPVREALRTALEVAEALEDAHGKGFVHRDLKPANIMLAAQGHAKVMDFGLAVQSAEPEGGRHRGRDLEPADPPGSHRRDTRLHVARAGRRKTRGLSQRRLLVRRGAARDGHRCEPLPPPERGRDPQRDSPRPASRAAPQGAPGFPRAPADPAARARQVAGGSLPDHSGAGRGPAGPERAHVRARLDPAGDRRWRPRPS